MGGGGGERIGKQGSTQGGGADIGIHSANSLREGKKCKGKKGERSDNGDEVKHREDVGREGKEREHDGLLSLFLLRLNQLKRHCSYETPSLLHHTTKGDSFCR